MEYAKDEIFTIEYSKEKTKRFNHHNIIKLLFSIGGIFCIANIIAIYNFFKIIIKFIIGDVI